MFAEYLNYILSTFSGESPLYVALFVVFPILKHYQWQQQKSIYTLKKKLRKPRLGNTDPLQGRHKWLGELVDLIVDVTPISSLEKVATHYESNHI